MIVALIAVTTAPLAQAAPLVPREHHYRSFNVHAALAAGCHISQVYIPTGKPGHVPAVIRCPAPVKALEAGERKKTGSPAS